MTTLKDLLLAERRRHERHAVELPVVFNWGGPQEAATHDVSYGGVYLRTKVLPPLGQLIRVEFPRIPGREPVVIHAVVARIASQSGRSGRPQGIGLALFGMGKEGEAAWRALVDEIAAGTLGQARKEEELLTLADEPRVSQSCG